MALLPRVASLLLVACATSNDDALPALLETFPESFAFGVATAAYQIEGATDEGGRGPSIWDTFSAMPGKTFGGDTGAVADDFYHKFRDDVALMASLGVTRYRMSLAWPRLLPDGGGAALNPAGVAFYVAVFEELQKYGIEPLVTLYHWDLPQALDDSYGGWLDREIVADFANYADLCFAAFGDYATSWTTFNEALTFIGEGYGDGVHAPGRCSDRDRCAAGDSMREPLVAGHHVLLAHAAAVAKFRARFDSTYEIGMVNCGWMAWPLRGRGHAGDAEAAEAFMEAQWGWFYDPVIYGDYPDSLKKRAGADLPAFTAEEKEALKGSATTSGAEGIPHLDGRFHVSTVDAAGASIGARAGSPWLYVAPAGLRDVLIWLDARYPGHSLLVTENGCAQPDALDAADAVDDGFRLAYLRDHVDAAAEASAAGVDVIAYYAWSLLDNYEWADGYSKRFGLVYVDYGTLDRTPKRSARWFARVLAAHAARTAAALVVVPDPAAPAPASGRRGAAAPLPSRISEIPNMRLRRPSAAVARPRQDDVSEAAAAEVCTACGTDLEVTAMQDSQILTLLYLCADVAADRAAEETEARLVAFLMAHPSPTAFHKELGPVCPEPRRRRARQSGKRATASKRQPVRMSKRPLGRRKG
ncbi:beta-glucosidase [Aureococcus anophagefferens]|nr:beta-glucosidase [Aureococcus anophagefferens]